MVTRGLEMAKLHEPVTPILDSFIREKAYCYDLLGHWYSKQQLYSEALNSFSHAKTIVESYDDVYLLKK